MRLTVLAIGLAAVAASALAGCRSGRPRAYFAAERTRGARVADARPVETKNFIPLEAQAPEAFLPDLVQVDRLIESLVVRTGAP